MKHEFYVYLHRKATNGEVFYVGKGNGVRAYGKNSRNRFWNYIVKKHGLVVDIAYQGLQEWYAFELEQELIAYYGRKDLGLGNLCNMTDGMEGASGYKHSKESLEKFSGDNNPSKRKDVRKKISEAMSGRSMPWFANEKNPMKQESVRAKISGVNCYKAKNVVCNETGVVFQMLLDAEAWLKSIGNEKASYSKISQVCTGKRKSAYGYTWSYA